MGCGSKYIFLNTQSREVQDPPLGGQSETFMLTDVHGRDDQADLLTRRGVTARQVNNHMHLSPHRCISPPALQWRGVVASDSSPRT
jgi:hypothetical protein